MSQATQVMEDKIRHAQGELSKLERNMASDLSSVMKSLGQVQANLSAHLKPLTQELHRACYLPGDSRHTTESRIAEFGRLVQTLEPLEQALTQAQNDPQAQSTLQSLGSFRKHLEQAQTELKKWQKERQHLDNVLNASAQEGPGFDAPFEAPFLVPEVKEQLKSIQSDQKETLSALQKSITDFKKQTLQAQGHPELKKIVPALDAFLKAIQTQDNLKQRRESAKVLSETLQSFIYEKTTTQLQEQPYQTWMPELYAIKCHVDHDIDCDNRILNLQDRLNSF